MTLFYDVFLQTQALVRDSPVLTSIAQGPLYPLLYVVQQTIHWLFMGYSLVPFCLFTYDKWLKVCALPVRHHHDLIILILSSIWIDVSCYTLLYSFLGLLFRIFLRSHLFPHCLINPAVPPQGVCASKKRQWQKGGLKMVNIAHLLLRTTCFITYAHSCLIRCHCFLPLV